MALSLRPLIWTVAELAEFLGAEVTGLGGQAVPVSRLNNSLEHVAPGDLYVPLGLTAGDPLQVAARAVAAGAVGAMLQASPGPGAAPGPPAFPVIRVPDLDAAIRALARHARQRFGGRVIGVTGSVGKTTTKDMIALCLSHCGPTHHTEANLNAGRAHLAAVASLPAQAAFSVLEIAMMGKGAVRRKTAVARPHVGVITSIGLSHGAHHGTAAAEAILMGKTEMFAKMIRGGTAVLPSGDRMYPRLVARAQESGRIRRILSCGTGETDDVQLLDCTLHPTWSEVAIRCGKTRVGYAIGQPGAHFVRNSLLAAGVILAVGGNPAALGALAGYTPTGRRIERFRCQLPGGGVTELIDDSYNAAPDSVRALLDILTLRDRVRRKVLVLGDMLELGPDELRHHLELAPDIAAAGIGLLITVGPKAARLAEVVPGIETRSYPDVQAARAGVAGLLQDRDLVAVKGSNGIGLVNLVAALAGPAGQRRRRDRHWSIEVEPA